jgi:hypothetical protein
MCLVGVLLKAILPMSSFGSKGKIECSLSTKTNLYSIQVTSKEKNGGINQNWAILVISGVKFVSS